jgi:glutamate-1-semialdehyde 2,1-aminomutase
MYRESERLLERALKVIPNGTQTFSKSRTCYPAGVSPFYAEVAHGSHLQDVDGNTFIDFTSGLTAVILGYFDKDVTKAVTNQLLDSGVIFSLPHKLEIEVSEMLVDMIPSAEMVRFGKNGSDTTTGAVRLARAYTGRDHVAMCGYHGWHDWSNGMSGRNLGVPQAVKDLTHVFQYNDIDSLHRLFKDRPGQYACVIMEPMNRHWPQDDFLSKVKDLAHANGALFIMDETITGFRFSIGGAQQLFGVTPDLSTFGKGIANGYPLSALVGREEVMQTLNNVHFSFTNAGECLSLAAAKATLKKIKEENVPGYLVGLGLSIPGDGHPAWRHLNIGNKTLFMQEMHKRGILCLGTVNLNYAHTQEDVDKLIQALNEWEGAELECEPLQTGFKIR